VTHRMLSAALFSSLGLLPAQIAFAPGDRVAFLGDSITEAGQGHAGGYVQLVASGLAANGVPIEVVGAGISGHKSNDMLARLERDVLRKKPQWMTLSCGVNDVWHGKNGVSLDDYKQNITTIVDQATAAGVQVVILTSTRIGEDAATPENQRLARYNEFLRSLAAAKQCRLADLDAEMQAALAAAKQAKPKPRHGNYLTTDGVHMAFAGDEMMALGVLKGIGLDAAQLAKAKAAWLDVPDTNHVRAGLGLTQRQAQRLEQVAAARKVDVDQLVHDEFRAAVLALLKAGN
jgi:lysophospholipase L1-like esterase